MKLLRIGTLLIVLCLPGLARSAPPTEQAELPGTLVIVGGGKMPDAVREEFFRHAGGKDRAKIVVIPTASASADEAKETDGFLKQWKDLEPASVTFLHTRDKAKADDAEFVKPIAEATAVWFSGGDQNRLTATYGGTLVSKELVKLFRRGGTIGGTSAGAAVISDLMIAGGTDEAKTAEGFGLLPGVVIDQHFTQRKRIARLHGAVEKNPGYVGLGIDESTAVIARGRTLKVLGEGTVTATLAKSETKAVRDDVVKSGGEFDLFQLRRAALARAAKVQFPPAVPPVPDVAKGSLVIVGGGGAGPEIWKKFIDLAGGTDALLIVVPTSMEDPLPKNIVEVTLLRQNGATNVKVFHTRDRKAADDPEFTKALTEAKGVWFGGGRHWRFADSYEGTLSEKRFHEVLARGGSIGGSSAGASIQAHYMPRGHPLGNTVVAAEGYERGFGFLPGCVVDQHFFARKRPADMTGLMKQYPQLLGIGIDEGTAIIVKGTKAEVIGRSKVAFYDYSKGIPKTELDYEAVPSGVTYDLKARAVTK